VLEVRPDLRDEFTRLFPELPEPPDYDPNEVFFKLERTEGELTQATADALLNLRLLGGWIQGLIDEQTLERRIRAEAEERAKRPPTGFGA